MSDTTPSRQSDRNARLAQFTIERASDPIFWVDAHGRFYGANEAACRLYSYTRDEWLSMKVFDINPTITPEDWPEIWNDIRKQQALTFESEHIRKNGDRFPVEISVNYVEFEGEAYHCSFIRDISDRKRVQEQIASLSKFPDENPNPILRLSQDGTILYHNKASTPLLDLWNCQAGSSLSGPWCPLVQKAFQSGEPQLTEISVKERAYSVTLAPVSEEGYINIYALDITERKHIEEEQKRARDRTIQHQAALLSLVRGTFPTREAVCQRVTQLVANTLEVERVSIWLLENKNTLLKCLDVFVRSKGSHEQGLTLSIDGYPRYFAALNDNLTIAAHDARSDPRTSEFAVGYLDVLGITSMMDSPIFERGKIIGVVCHEHIGPPRGWSLDEQQFGSSIADFISHTFESLERQRVQKQAYGLMEDLGNRVKELTALHQTARLVQDPLASPQEVVHQLLPLWRAAWQHPDITEVRIAYADIDVATPNFQPTNWMQRAKFSTGDGTEGILEISYLQERPLADEGPFTKEERNLINSLSEMLRAFFERKRVERALEERIQFEDLIATISTKFINLPTEEIDSAVSDALRVIGEFTGVDRSHLYLFSEDGSTMSKTHEWHIDGLQPQIERFQRIPLERISWAIEQLKRHAPLHIPRVADLPPEASREKELILSVGNIQSLIIVPLVRQGQTIGFLGLDAIQREQTWDQDSVALLRMVGEIFVNAFERKAAEEAVRQAQTQLEQRVQDRTAELSQANIRLTEEIAERQRGEEALRLAEQKYHSIVENAVEGIYQSSPGGQFLSVNPALAKMYGYASPDELIQSIDNIGKQIYVDPFYRERFVRHLEKHGTVQGFECQVYHRNGTVFWISEHARAVMDHEGKLLFYEGTIQDITSRKKAEEALQQAKEAAESANQAKSEFLANMSHELRTPLNGILGYAQILKGDRELTEDQRSGLDVIHRSGEHLLMLINDILDLSKIEAHKLELLPTAFDFQEFLTTIVEIIKVRSDQAKLSFHYDIPDSLPQKVEGDEKRLRQVLLNLLGNAVKFTDVGQITFTITADATPEVPYGLRFQIEDTGIGVSPEHLDDIFLPFHQITDTNRQVEGTGLGLTITNKLVALMGGVLQVESHIGHGSRFWFTVPLTPVAHAALSKSADLRRVVGIKRGPTGILIIDDKLENRSVLSNLLKGKGFTIYEATNGQEGISLAQKHHPGIIFMDLVMPVMDGFAATKIIRKIPDLKKTVIIALSASAFEHSRQESLNAGCNAFLTKPLREHELLQILETHAGIEWEYEQDTQGSSNSEKAERTLSAPPYEALNPLYELAKKGKIIEVRKHIEGIAQMGDLYLPFTKELRRFAQAFNMKQLCEFLEPYIREKP